MGLPVVKVEEFGYVPSARWGHTFESLSAQTPGDVLNENIARVESLKIKLSQLALPSEADRDQLLEDLDVLRGALIAFGSRPVRPVEGEGPGAAAGPLLPSADDLIIEGIIGTSPAITQALKIIAAVAPTSLTVLLEGETGTGKELFARIIHLNSHREKFVAVNCGAFPQGVIESELFGHVKGAFTGASADRNGKFEEAHDGTIFLDEIGELKPYAQVKLLRVLEAGEIQRVGSDKNRKVNVRVITATNRNLREMVQRGTFREDLYYRINLCPVFLPPLRERRDEIEILVEYFLQEACAKMNRPLPQLDAELRHFLLKVHDYPGNIRELKNMAQFLACIGAGRPLGMADLPASRPLSGAGTPGRKAVVQEAEKEYWTALLKKHRGSVQKVCQETQLSRSRVYQILERYHLRAGSFR